jgi:hypothetical protein
MVHVSGRRDVPCNVVRDNLTRRVKREESTKGHQDCQPQGSGLWNDPETATEALGFFVPSIDSVRNENQYLNKSRVEQRTSFTSE